MKRKKLLLRLCMLIGILLFGPTSAWADDSGTCGDCLTWTYSNGTLTISGTGPMDDYSAIGDTPWYYLSDGEGTELINKVVFEEGVTTIGACAFNYCKGLTTVEMSTTITTIGKAAFSYCSNLTTINFKGNIRNIGNSSFSDSEWYNRCSDGAIYIDKVLYKYKGTMASNTSFAVKDGTVQIGPNAFQDQTGLTSVTFPESLENIGYMGFYRCSGLTSVIIPQNVQTIDYSAFYNCSNLETITFQAQQPNIGYGAFYGTKWYTNLPDGLNYINKVAYRYKGTMSANTSIIIQNGTKSISSQCFSDCGNLSSITIPSGVTYIGHSAFNRCRSLSSITIPNSVKYIGEHAFMFCTGLTSIDIPEGVTCIEGEAFQYCNFTNITLPSTLTIANRALYMCGSTTNYTITLKEGMTTIPTGLFTYSRATNVVIPSTVKTIEDRAFNTCEKLTSITIPSGVESIGKGAFSSCYALTSISIPASVNSIGSGVLKGCKALETITVDANNDYYTVENGVLYNKNMTSLLAYPAASANTSFVIPNNVKTIGEGAFQYCANLQNITLPDGLTTIGPRAFSEATQLGTITIPNSVTSIGADAFYKTALTTITIPKSVTYIGSQPFRRVTSLQNIVVDKDNQNYSNYNDDGVVYDKDITNVLFFPAAKTVYTAPETLTTFNFRDLFSLDPPFTSLTIPANVSSLGEDAYLIFKNCNVVLLYTAEDQIPPAYHVSCTNSTIYVDNNLLSTFQAADGWSTGTYKGITGISFEGNGVTDVTLASDAVTYTGAEIVPAINKVSLGTATLTLNDETTTTHNFAGMKVPSSGYTVTATNNKNAGSATATLTGKGLFSGSVSKSFTINPKALTDAMVTITGASKVYNGENQQPTLSVTDGTALTQNDYTISGGGKNVGTYGVTVTAQNNYTGTVTKPECFTITPKPLTVTAQPKAITYGEAPANNGVTYSEFATGETESVLDGTLDYDYTYGQFGNVGDSYTIMPKGLTSTNYDITFSPGTLTVNKANMSIVDIAAIEDQTIATGGSASPAVSVTINGHAVSTDDYTPSYEGIWNAGTGNVTLTATENGNFIENTTKQATYNILRALGIEFNGGNRKWATYYAAEDLTLPEGMSAYTVTSVSGNVVTLSELTYIPQNVGVLLSYENSGADFAAAKYTGTTSTYTSLLRGATTAQTMEAGTNYVLYNNEFVRAEGSELAANRCYLHLDAAAPALVLAIDGSATSIGAELGAASDDAQWFTLDGRKLTAKPARKGLYIKNGTKVVIK